ncbi:DNA-directed RNA polymerase III subunit RPC3 [Borealophlyctis nickersoniae]|nr:DNA-directed RNA polymerase III subunit RPC3 [Borealophlyctis nickersoniae]
MSQTSVRLCRAIIYEHFGPIVEKVAQALLTRGRMHLGMILQATKLSQRLVKESLFVLLQHNIVVYAETAEGSRMIVYYRAEVDRILLMDRFPLYVQTTKQLFGQQYMALDYVKNRIIDGRGKASEVVMEVLKHGRINCPFLSTSASLQVPPKRIMDTFTLLVEERLLVRATAADSIAVADRRMAEEAEEVNKKGGIPLTATEMKKMRMQLAAKRAEYDETQATGSAGLATHSEFEGLISQKRKVVLDYEEVENKRQADNSLEICGEANHYRINYERFHVHLRNEELAKLAGIQVNDAAGEIIRQMLRHVEDKSRSCKEEERTEPISQMTVAAKLPADTNLLVEGSGGNKLAEYMEVLAQEPEAFIQKTAESGGGSYAVCVRSVVTRLQQRIIESMMTERFGDHHKRIWRILNAMDKLDEKQISKIAMMPPKDARKCLYDLHEAGFAFIQDVPKNSDHTAARTYFLWYISIPRTVDYLIQNGYRALANAKQRRAKEVSGRAMLIEKTQRSDVLSGEAKLSEAELKGVEQLNGVIKRLRASEARLDKMLLILRDC